MKSTKSKTLVPLASSSVWGLMLNAILAITTTLVAVESAVQAEPLTVDELRSVQKKLKSADQVSVAIKQIKTSATRPNKPVVADGRAIFAKPDKFRWSLGEPINEETIFNGSEMIKVRPTEKVGIRYPAKGSESLELRRVVDLVLNLEALLDRYDLVSAERKKDLISVVLKPKVPQDIAQLSFTLNTTANFMSNLEMQMSNKMKLAIEFQNPNFSPLTGDVFAVGKDIRLTELN